MTIPVAVRTILVAVLAIASCAAGIAGTGSQTTPKPNIVLIVADDLGWVDLHCYGNTFQDSPNLDKLASQGMRFSDAYAAAAVCSPSRAAIMTGKYPARLHLTDWIPGYGDAPDHLLLVPEWTKYLPTTEYSLPRPLGALGYFSASVGKWHMGGEGSNPLEHGFAVNVAGSHLGQPPSYFWPYENSKKALAIADLRTGGKPGEYLPDRLTDEAIRLLKQHAAKPFFLYFPHYSVHLPLQAKEDMIRKYMARPGNKDKQTAAYAAMVESMDESVGRIMQSLDDLNLTTNTVLLFTSDNGGRLLANKNNKPLRDGKGFPYEGGTRVPLIVRWPGRIQAGSSCSVPVSGMDLYPTLIELAGGRTDAMTTQPVDGVSLLPLLTQSGQIEREALFWHYPHYWHAEVRPWASVRSGDWKLIEFLETGRLELYDLKNDLGESRDLAASNKSRTEELANKLNAWRKFTGAQMPTRNPAPDQTSTTLGARTAK